MDQILLPLVHTPLSHDTVINSHAKSRLVTSLVTALVMHSVTGHALAELPPGYSYQNAHLGVQESPCPPCPNQRTITQIYEYEIPTQETYGTTPNLDVQQYSARQFNIGNQGFIVFDIF